MDISDISKIVFVGTQHKQDDACPVATKDIAVNLKNRQKAIDAADYGPLNPQEANPEFWGKMAEQWNVSQADAKKQRCGNCAAFIKSERILKCINDGLSAGDEQDSWAVVEAGDLGYCEAFDFKCAAKRTCSAWIVGGPIVDETTSRDANDSADMEAKSALLPDNHEEEVLSYLDSLSDDDIDILFPEDEPLSDGEAKWLFDVAGAFLRRSITNRRGRRKKSDSGELGEKGAKRPVLRDPDGGLTAAGRKYFKNKEGANLRPGVKGPANTPLKMRRKGSFLVRFFSNPRGPLVDKNGNPTRLALSARAWGEPAPTNVAAAHKLAAKGRSLLERYRRYQENEKKSADITTNVKALGNTIGQQNQQQIQRPQQGGASSGAASGNYDPNARDADGDGTVQEGTDYSRPVDDKKKPKRSGSADASERRTEADERARTGRGQGYDKIETPQQMEAYRRSQGLPARTIVPLPSSRTSDGRSVPAPRRAGNIDLTGRKPVTLSDGSVATIRSMSFNDGQSEVVIPTIGPKGEDLTDDQAIALYEKTGSHLGKFDDVESAETYAQWLHEEEDRRVNGSDATGSDRASMSADRSEREEFGKYLEDQGFDAETAEALGEWMMNELETMKPGAKTNWLPGRLPNGGRIAENGTYIPPDMVRRDDKTQSDYYRNRREERAAEDRAGRGRGSFGPTREGEAGDSRPTAPSAPKRPSNEFGDGTPRTPWSTEPRSPADGGPRTPWSTEPRSPADGGPRTPWSTEPRSPADGGPRTPWSTEPRSPADGGPRTPWSTGPQAPGGRRGQAPASRSRQPNMTTPSGTSRPSGSSGAPSNPSRRPSTNRPPAPGSGGPRKPWSSNQKPPGGQPRKPWGN